MTDPQHDTDALLSRFRAWMEEARSEMELLDREEAATDGPDRSVGLYRLVEEFTALRHELKLQTKSARGLEEQAESLLSALRQAMEHFRSATSREVQAVWAAGRPLAEALAELDVALDRARREFEKAGRRLIEEPAHMLEEALAAQHARLPWYRRRFHRAYLEQVLEIVRADPPRRQKLLGVLIEGYDLIQARLRRTLQAEQVARIVCVGVPVDPERMTVVEVVDDANSPPGYVVEEVRPGYTWQGRVLRYAEVRATRTPPAASDLSPSHTLELSENA